MMLVEDTDGVDRQWDANSYHSNNGALVLYRGNAEVARYAAGTWRWVCPRPEIDRGKDSDS